MKPRTLLFLVLAAGFLLAGTAFAQEACLEDLEVWQADGEVRMRCRAVNGFTSGVTQTIENGFSTTFAFDIKLYRSRKLWFSESIATVRVEKTVKYLRVKEEYEIRSSDGTVTLLKDKEALEAALLELPELTVVRLDRLSPDGSYTLGVRALVWAATLPLFLDYLLLGTTLVEVDTGWKEVDVVLPLEPLEAPDEEVSP